MKHIRNTVVTLILVLCGASVWAETSFTIAPVLHWTWADIREYVITYPNLDTLSELDWDAHNIMQFGVKTEITHDRLVISADFASASETDSGLLQDYDWFFADPGQSNPNNYSVDTLTHFSEHQLTLQHKDRIDIRAGLKVIENRRFSLILGGGFQFHDVQFHGHDGYLQYPTGSTVTPYSPDRPKIMVYGDAISYRQNVQSLWVDVRADFILNSSFTISAGGGISPWQYIRCIDIHHQRNLVFKDYPYSNMMYSGQLSTVYSFGKRSSLILSGDMLYMPLTAGNDLVYSASGILLYKASELGGTDYLGWDISLSYRIRIF